MLLSNEQKYRLALETLATCLPNRIFVYDGFWTDFEASVPEDIDYEVIDFEELLGC